MLDQTMLEKTGKPHKFFSGEIYRNDPELRNFIEETWKYLRSTTDQITGDAIDYKKDNGDKMNEFQKSYNFLNFINTKMHDVMLLVKNLTIEACEYYEIDYEKEKYYVSCWINYTKGPRIITPGQISFDDHGSDPKEFHGYYAIDAEPHSTVYKLDHDVLFPHENKNGKILLSLNGYHHGVDTWPFEKPRITIAFNIVPLNKAASDPHIPWIPLL
jgi:hypothetical protein